jgi:hypothetical protein
MAAVLNAIKQTSLFFYFLPHSQCQTCNLLFVVDFMRICWMPEAVKTLTFCNSAPFLLPSNLIHDVNMSANLPLEENFIYNAKIYINYFLFPASIIFYYSTVMCIALSFGLDGADLSVLRFFMHHMRYIKRRAKDEIGRRRCRDAASQCCGETGK